MIEFQNFSFCYPEAEQATLQQINLQIQAGNFALVVGNSGCGKSTLVRCIGGLVPHFSGGQIKGRLTVDGKDPIALGPRQLSRMVGYVFQDPEAQAILDVVEDEIAFALEHAGLEPKDMRLRIEEVLDLLDLAALRDRQLDQLSGGERQRVAIAAALALRPNILVLDEPTSQLDPQSAEDVLQALVRLNSDLGITIVLVEHRLERVLPYIDQLIYLENGQAISGDPQQILAEIPLAPPMVQLAKQLGWSPLPLSIKQGLRFSRNIQLAPAPSQPLSTQKTLPRLAIEHLEAQYQQQRILHNINFQLWPGEIVVLLGRNGAGKSTLLKSIVGLVRPSYGRILLNGHDTSKQSVASICQEIGYLPQDPNALLFAETVAEECAISLRNHAINDTMRISQTLQHLGLSNKAQAYPRDLSVGERQRVALATLLVSQPHTMLLDEPTRGLDYQAKTQLARILIEWKQRGLAVLLVSHDVEFAAQIASRIIIMGRGDIIAQGQPQQILAESPLFAPQITRLFPNQGYLHLEQVLKAFY
jgi:energy-coupling factor transporter ATP-binding protein EcfA2